MEYEIQVGNLFEIKKGFLKGSFKIMYCGMCNEDTFVLAPYVSQGYQGFSPNIYYKLSSKRIYIWDRLFDIIEVTPDYIVLSE